MNVHVCTCMSCTGMYMYRYGTGTCTCSTTPPTQLRQAPVWPFSAASTSPTPRLPGSNRSTPSHCVPSLEKNDRQVGHIPAPCVPWWGKCRLRNPPRSPSVGAWCGTAHHIVFKNKQRSPTNKQVQSQHSNTKNKINIPKQHRR